MFGKRDYTFYSNRFTALQKYYDVVSKEPKITLDVEWLKFFKLQYDPAAALRLQMFTRALQTICEKESIDWEYSFGYAQRLGLEGCEADLLKIVAVEKIGRDAAARVYEKVLEVTPGFIPGSVKTKMANTAEGKLFVAIGTTVETAWTGVEQGFNKVADGLNSAMDKAMDPLKKMFDAVLGPCKDLVAAKLSSKGGDDDDKGDEMDEALKKIKAARFPPLKDAFAALAKGAKAAETCRSTMERVCDLDHTWKYAPYIQYPSGDSILEWFPPIEEIVEKHNRLTVAAIDVVYVLGRGLCRALEPLCEYVDKASENFDEKCHQDEVAKAVWTGGKRLALDYFSLPYSTWRACWYCGNSVTQEVLKFCKTTVNLEADLLGTVATNWKPTSKADVKSSFAQALQVALDAFIGSRAFVLACLIRESSIQMVAELFNSMIGESIAEIAGVLNDLVAQLPPPLSDLKPGDIVSNLIQNLVKSASTAAIKRWAAKTERFLADPNCGQPPTWKEELAAKFRVAPRIRKDDDDNSKPEISEEDKKRQAKKGAAAPKKEKKEKKEGDEEEKEEEAEAEAGAEEAGEEAGGGGEDNDGGNKGGGED